MGVRWVVMSHLQGDVTVLLLGGVWCQGAELSCAVGLFGGVEERVCHDA